MDINQCFYYSLIMQWFLCSYPEKLAGAGPVVRLPRGGCFRSGASPVPGATGILKVLKK